MLRIVARLYESQGHAGLRGGPLPVTVAETDPDPDSDFDSDLRMAPADPYFSHLGPGHGGDLRLLLR